MFDFLDLSIKYLSNATFGTSLPFKMSLLERLEKVNFTKNQFFGPTSGQTHLVLGFFFTVDDENQKPIVVPFFFNTILILFANLFHFWDLKLKS